MCVRVCVCVCRSKYNYCYKVYSEFDDSVDCEYCHDGSDNDHTCEERNNHGSFKVITVHCVNCLNNDTDDQHGNNDAYHRDDRCFCRLCYTYV